MSLGNYRLARGWRSPHFLARMVSHDAKRIHLRCLSDCGLVVSEREGRNVRYELSDPRVAQLVGLAEELLADVARGVYACTRYSDKDVPRT